MQWKWLNNERGTNTPSCIGRPYIYSSSRRCHHRWHTFLQKLFCCIESSIVSFVTLGGVHPCDLASASWSFPGLSISNIALIMSPCALRFMSLTFLLCWIRALPIISQTVPFDPMRYSHLSFILNVSLSFSWSNIRHRNTMVGLIIVW